MTTVTNQKPAAKLRDGAITATLWKREGEHGVFFNTTIARTFKEGDRVIPTRTPTASAEPIF